MKRLSLSHAICSISCALALSSSAAFANELAQSEKRAVANHEAGKAPRPV